MISRALVTLLMLLLPLPLTAAEFIESFHSEIEVRRSGELQVTETIRVKAEGKSIRRGIFRDFPTRYKTSEGRDMVVGFELLSVRRDGVAEAHHIENRSNGKRIYIGQKQRLLDPGYYEYQLSYLTTRQLGFFEDFDELYWNVTGTGWDFEINQASALVILPDSVSDFELTGYTGRRGSKQQNLEYRRAGANQVYFETSQPLGRNQGLTIVAAWPKGLIDEPSAAQQRRWLFEDNKSSILMVGGALLLLIYYLLLWRWVGRDPEAGVILPHYQPPSGYSPASMRYIEKMGYDNKCFTSAIINLAVKNQVEIKDDDGDFSLSKGGQSTAELAPGEKRIVSSLLPPGRDQLSIQQSNHSKLSAAINRHKKSLQRDYRKIYFNTNSRLLIPGVIATIVIIIAALASLPSEEVIVKTLFASIFMGIPLIMLVAAIRGIIRRGFRGLFQFAINLVFAAVFFYFFINDFPLEEFLPVVPLPMAAAVVVMLALHYFFNHLLKAPTLAGRRLLDKIEGFKHYLEVAEEDEIALQNAPRFSSDIYEAYLPYAIALDLENEWTAKLDKAISAGLVDHSYSSPHWYRGRHRGAGHFSRTLSKSFDSAIASSAVAPGSSSGSSSGGSSGGGGGGGGGGGW